MGYLIPVFVEIETSIVAGSSQSTFGHQDKSGQIFSVGHIAIEWGLNPDFPGLPLRIDPFAATFATNIHQVVSGSAALHERRYQIDRIAFGDRIEVELDAGVVLDNSPVLDMYSLVADEL